MISIRQLSKTYGSGTKQFQALKNINLEVKQGEIFGIVGRSGAGKSTLIRCVNLLERPSTGTVIVEGLELSSLTGSELRKARSHIGMIFQHFNLLANRTAYDNISLPLELAGKHKSEIKKKIEPLIELTGLSNQIHQYPHQLSGGQKQRVAIARALATSPKVLLSDEATSALDPHSTQAILELLRSINQTLGITILLITHEMHVIKNICHQVAILHEGEIVEQGHALELFTQPKTQIGLDFVRAASRMDLPSALKKVLLSEPGPEKTVVRISYLGRSISEPIISSLIKNYNLTVNILQANVECIQDHTMGIMIVEISDDEKNNANTIQQGINYLQQSGLRVEILGYAPRNA